MFNYNQAVATIFSENLCIIATLRKFAFLQFLSSRQYFPTTTVFLAM